MAFKWAMNINNFLIESRNTFFVRGGRILAQLTPMMQQYLNIHSQVKDAILFFRLGDFYEMFFDDAIIASKELDITLTGRDCGLDERAPMCGVPYHSAAVSYTHLDVYKRQVLICENAKLKMKIKQKTYEIAELKEQINREKNKKTFLGRLFR